MNRKKTLGYGLLAILLLSTGYVIGVSSNGANPTIDAVNGLFGFSWYNASTGVNSPKYVLNNDLDVTDVLEYPEQTASYVVFKSGSTIYAKNMSTGQLDFQGSNPSIVIQNSLDSLTASRTWIETIVIKGELTLPDIINVTSYSELMIQGYLTIPDNFDSTLFDVSGETNIVFSGTGTIDGNKANQASGDIIECTSTVSYLTIKDLTFKNAKRSSFYMGDTSSQWSEYITITNTKHIDSPYPLWLKFARRILIDGNHITQPAAGSQYSIYLDYCRYVGTISNNVIYGGDINIRLNGCHDFSVTGNSIEGGVGGGITIMGDSAYVVVSGNSIKGMSKEGIEIASADHNSIVGNVMYDCDMGGLKMWDFNYNLISSNFIIDSACSTPPPSQDYPISAGIIIYTQNPAHTSFNNTIIDNYILNTGGITPISDYGIAEIEYNSQGVITDNTIKGNTIKNVDVSGIILASGSTSSVTNNEGFTTETSGIETLVSGQTSKTVSHGCDYTPSAGDISVHPIESLGSASFFWVDTITSSQFTIRVNVNPAQDVDFAWSVDRH